ARARAPRGAACRLVGPERGRACGTDRALSRAHLRLVRSPTGAPASIARHAESRFVAEAAAGAACCVAAGGGGGRRGGVRPSALARQRLPSQSRVRSAQADGAEAGGSASAVRVAALRLRP